MVIKRKTKLNFVLSYFHALILCLFSQEIFADNFKISAPHEAKSIPAIENLILSAYQKINIQAEIVRMPAQRALVEASKNTWVDAELARVEIAEDILKGFIKIPIILSEFSVNSYHVDNTLLISDWQSLTPYKVATLRGLIGVTSKLVQNKIDFHQVNSIKQAVEMVLSHRVDIAIIPSAMTAVENKSPIFDKSVFIINQLDELAIYHFVHKRHSTLIPELTRTISDLTKVKVTDK